MLRVIGILVVLWLALVVVRAIVKALFWIAAVGLLLLLLTVGWSWAQQRTRR